MKKVLIFMLFLTIYLSIDEPSINVFDEVNDNIDFYYVEIENLNTENLEACFTNLDIKSIEIKLNPLYDINSIFFYKNISFFKKNVINRLKEKGYYMEANKYLIQNININKVLVYNTKMEIMDSVNKCNKEYIISKKD